MTKEKKVTLKIDINCASAIRQVLFESQRGYGCEHVPERVTNIRSVINDLDIVLDKSYENN